MPMGLARCTTRCVQRRPPYSFIYQSHHLTHPPTPTPVTIKNAISSRCGHVSAPLQFPTGASVISLPSLAPSHLGPTGASHPRSHDLGGWSRTSAQPARSLPRRSDIIGETGNRVEKALREKKKKKKATTAVCIQKPQTRKNSIMACCPTTENKIFLCPCCLHL